MEKVILGLGKAVGLQVKQLGFRLLWPILVS